MIQLQEASRLHALLLMGDFNHPDTCWKSYTAGCKQSRRFLECIEDKFQREEKEREKPNRGETFLDLVLASAEELIKEVKNGGSLGCTDHAPVEFVISRDMGLAKSKVKTLNFRRANFHLFKELVDEIPRDTVLRDRGSDQSW